MPLPVYQNLDSIQRPSAGATVLTAWGDAVNDDVTFLNGEAWVAPTLVNGWVNYGAGYAPAGYRRVGNVVRLRGFVTGGAASSGLFTLPAGYRPAYPAVLVVDASGGFGAVVVGTTGAVVHNAGSVASFLDLDGLSFDLI